MAVPTLPSFTLSQNPTALGAPVSGGHITGDFQVGNPKKSDLPTVFWIGAAFLGAAILYRAFKK